MRFALDRLAGRGADERASRTLPPGREAVVRGADAREPTRARFVDVVVRRSRVTSGHRCPAVTTLAPALHLQ